MFFEAPEFWNVMRNTLVISLLKLIISFPAPILLALMLNEIGNMGFKRIIQTVSYLPYFLSWVIVSGFVFSLLSVDNGTVNYVLERFNLVGEPVNFLKVTQILLVDSSKRKCVERGRIREHCLPYRDCRH